MHGWECILFVTFSIYVCLFSHWTSFDQSGVSRLCAKYNLASNASTEVIYNFIYLDFFCVDLEERISKIIFSLVLFHGLIFSGIELLFVGVSLFMSFFNLVLFSINFKSRNWKWLITVLNLLKIIAMKRSSEWHH